MRGNRFVEYLGLAVYASFWILCWTQGDGCSTHVSSAFGIPCSRAATAIGPCGRTYRGGDAVVDEAPALRAGHQHAVVRLDVPVDTPRAVHNCQAGREVVEHVQDGGEGALNGAPPARIDCTVDWRSCAACSSLNALVRSSKRCCAALSLVACFGRISTCIRTCHCNRNIPL